MDFALGLLPGVAHAVSTIVVGYPFDTVKTRLQTGMYKGEWPIAQCVRDTLRTEGAASFYRGCSVPMAALLLKRPVEFAIFEEMQRANPLGVADGWKGFAHGSVAGLTGAFFGCPFNVVKVRVQDYTAQKGAPALTAEGSGALANRQIVRAVVREVFLVEHSYFRGLPVALAHTIPAASLYLGFYGRLRDALLPKDDAAQRSSSYRYAAGGLAGATASSCMWAVMLPADTVRTVIQAQVGKTESVSIGGTIRTIYARQGARGFWAGLTPVVLRSLPSSFVSMGAYETTRSWVDKWRAERR